MAQPLVSIITPSFNQAAFIQATMDSVLSQDYPHIEYIVVDGGSTDGTVDILKACDDPRLTWVSEPDRGQSDAINKGLQKAQGDILAYLNSDDLYLPGAISVTVNAFNENPDVDLVYGDCIYIDKNGVQIGAARGEAFDLQQIVTGRVFMPQQSAFWRKRVTEAIGMFDESLHYTMDVDYWLRLFADGFKPAYFPGERGAYRLHGDSKTVSQMSGFWRDWDTMIDKFFHLPALSQEMAQMRTNIKQNYLWMYTLYAPWKQGYRIELRPYLKQIITGAVPLRHRFLAIAMIVDTYLQTSFADAILQRFERRREMTRT